MSKYESPRQELDALDRILLYDAVIEPPAGFERRVMEAVRQEAGATEPIGFPWRLAGSTVAVSFALGAVAAIGVDPASVPEPSAVAAAVSRAAGSDVVLGLAVAVAGVLGSLAVAWASLAMARPRTLRVV